MFLTSRAKRKTKKTKKKNKKDFKRRYVFLQVISPIIRANILVYLANKQH